MYKPAKPIRNIIIGAGPAGIQLAYFFEKAGLDYVILERNEMAGSFFDRYPLSGQLISINKRHTGSDDADFNLRHDWNSLISDDGPKFTDYSKEYYPDRKDLVRYMGDFAAKYKMKIKYSHKVHKIKKVEGGYALTVEEPGGQWQLWIRAGESSDAHMFLREYHRQALQADGNVHALRRRSPLHLSPLQ